METNNEKNDDGFILNIYSPGNLIAKEINISGSVYLASGESNHKQNGYTDEQIAQAIEQICGKDKPLNIKQLWAGVYWCLRWYCNFPVKGTDFCDRVKTLPFSKKLDPECDYNNIRRQITMSFMNQDCREMEKVKPSRDDEQYFILCRTIVIALVQELGKISLLKI